MPNIKNIIFDFGGVIINIDEGKVSDELAKRGVKNIEKLHKHMLGSDIYTKLETGVISDQKFRDEIKAVADIDISDDEIDAIWNSIILDIPPNRVELLKELQNNYRTFLLSNTNIIHWYFYQDEFRKKYGFKGLSELFEMDYYSYLMGVRKPDPEIFMMVLQENYLKPDETLFIDDNLNNCLTARQLGMHAYNIRRDEDLSSLFNNGMLRIDLSDTV